MKKTEQARAGLATQLRGGDLRFSLTDGTFTLGGGEAQVYRAMREAVPILDAAIGKLVRLTGGFTVECDDEQAQRELRRFLQRVPIGRGQ